MISAPQSPSRANSFAAVFTVESVRCPRAVSLAIMRENADGIPVDEKVSNTQKSGYAIWYSPMP